MSWATDAALCLADELGASSAATCWTDELGASSAATWWTGNEMGSSGAAATWWRDELGRLKSSSRRAVPAQTGARYKSRKRDILD